MCDTLFDLRAGLARYAAGFDAALLSGPQAQSVVAEATAIVRMAAVVAAKAAARVAQSRAQHQELRTEMHAGFADIRGEMQSGFAELRAEFRAFRDWTTLQFASVRTAIQRLENPPNDRSW